MVYCMDTPHFRSTCRNLGPLFTSGWSESYLPSYPPFIRKQPQGKGWVLYSQHSSEMEPESLEHSTGQAESGPGPFPGKSCQLSAWDRSRAGWEIRFALTGGVKDKMGREGFRTVPSIGKAHTLLSVRCLKPLSHPPAKQ